jgi:hypothetical protein
MVPVNEAPENVAIAIWMFATLIACLPLSFVRSFLNWQLCLFAVAVQFVVPGAWLWILDQAESPLMFSWNLPLYMSVDFLVVVFWFRWALHAQGIIIRQAIWRRFLFLLYRLYRFAHRKLEPHFWYNREQRRVQREAEKRKAASSSAQG